MKKETNKKKKNNSSTKRNIQIVVISFILILLIGLMVYARNFRNFSSMKLRENNKEMLTVNDLVVGDISYRDNEKKVEKVLGKPNTESTKIIGSYSYKIKKYDGLTITMKEDYNDYVVTKITMTTRKFRTGRKIKVGSKITKVLNSYKVKNRVGSYMYGNYSMDSLNDLTVTKQIYIGYRDKEKVEYITRDSILDKSSPILTERITYEYKYGKVKKISWSYDVE